MLVSASRNGGRDVNDHLCPMPALADDTRGAPDVSSECIGCMCKGKAVDVHPRHEDVRAECAGSGCGCGAEKGGCACSEGGHVLDRREAIDPEKVFDIPANYRPMWKAEGKK